MQIDDSIAFDYLVPLAIALLDSIPPLLQDSRLVLGLCLGGQGGGYGTGPAWTCSTSMILLGDPR